MTATMSVFPNSRRLFQTFCGALQRVQEFLTNHKSIWKRQEHILLGQGFDLSLFISLSHNHEQSVKINYVSQAAAAFRCLLCVSLHMSAPVTRAPLISPETLRVLAPSSSVYTCCDAQGKVP